MLTSQTSYKEYIQSNSDPGPFMIDDLALTCLELVAQDTTRFSRIQLRIHVMKSMSVQSTVYLTVNRICCFWLATQQGQAYTHRPRNRSTTGFAHHSVIHGDFGRETFMVARFDMPLYSSASNPGALLRSSCRHRRPATSWHTLLARADQGSLSIAL